MTASPVHSDWSLTIDRFGESDTSTAAAEKIPPLRKRKARQRRTTIEIREYLTLDYPDRAETLSREEVLSTLTDADPAYQRRRNELDAVLEQFGRHGLTLGTQDASPVPASSVQAARSFLSALPVTCVLPKVAPDGDGGILLAWDDSEPAVILTVDHWKLHLVVGPGTELSTHIDDVSFDGGSTPEAILKYLPTR